MKRMAYQILARFVSGLLVAGLLCVSAQSASLSLVARLPGRDYDVSHAATEIATFSDGSVCVYSIANPNSGRKCFVVPIDALGAIAHVRWAPDDSALAISGQDFDYTPGLWILQLADDEGVPVRIYSGRPPGPGSGGDNLEDFINSKQLIISPRYGGYAVFDIDTRAISSCGWGETDGATEWVPEYGFVIGTNRFGDTQVATAVGNSGEVTLSCNPVRRAQSTPNGSVWRQFEDAWGPDRLLFSEQIFDRGTEWKIGAMLVALDAETLEFVQELPAGAPASLSPRGDMIAALRRDIEDIVSVVVYRISDYVPVLELQLNGRVTQTPSSYAINYGWAALRPSWSPDGQYVLVNGVSGVGVELISVTDASVERVLDNISSHQEYRWIANDRLIGKSLSGIRIYELLKDDDEAQ